MKNTTYIAFQDVNLVYIRKIFITAKMNTNLLFKKIFKSDDDFNKIFIKYNLILC